MRTVSHTQWQTQHPTKQYLICAFVAALLVSMCLFCACSSNTSSSSSSSSSTSGTTKVSIGTLATEDILPYWVAEAEGDFEKAGIDAEIVVFQSATELIAGVTSGQVNLAMTDPMVAASIYASGTDIQLSWVTLGTTAEQGRFGIMVGPHSSFTSLSDLTNIPIGVGSNTILEYVMDTLLTQAGVSEEYIITEELQKLPVRYQQMLEENIAAAALPASLLALGEAQGCILIADDTKGENISQSVMIVRNDFLEKEDGQKTLEQLKSIWDSAAKKINDNPEKYRELLVEKANLSEAVAASYPISTYPLCQLPTSDMINPVLEWMSHKGYLSTELTYDEQTGKFSRS